MLGAPDYVGFLRSRFGERVFIAFQGSDTETRPTITNNVEYLRAKHATNKILYRDTDCEWTGWVDGLGFFPLGVKSVDVTDSILKAFLLKVKFAEAEKAQSKYFK
jgi:hypothetical protein